MFPLKFNFTVYQIEVASHFDYTKSKKMTVDVSEWSTPHSAHLNVFKTLSSNVRRPEV